MTTGMFLLILIALALNARDASGVIVYRIGAPFTAAEKDSLEGLSIDFRDIAWSASQFEEALEPDSLQAGSLQPNFFDEDENIAATLFSRDGFLAATGTAIVSDDRVHSLIDQDPRTAYTWPAIAPEVFNKFTRLNWVYLDLGGRFSIREVAFRPLADRPEHFVTHFKIEVSGERTRVPDRIPNFTRLVEVRENTDPDVNVTLLHPATVRSMRLGIFRTTQKEIGIADIEIFGGGFVSPASYESDVIALDDTASLGEIRWSGRQDPHARVAIRTRAGNDPQPVIFWEARPEQQDSIKFLQGGGDLSLTEYKRQYEKLTKLFKPRDEADWVSSDTENWSFWSSPYAFEHPGVAFVSPGPRKYFQIRTDFSSTIEDGGKIDFIEVKASVPPLVRELVGEIYPIETAVGEPTHFTYYISPTIHSTDISFDGVEISTPSGVVSVDSLRIDAVDHDDFSWTIHEDGLGFEVLLPRRLKPTDSGALVEVVFTAPVLREVGNQFAGRVFDTERPHEVRQRVVPGNAADEIEGDRLSVRTALSESLVFSPRISPNPFTPNGDGVNDVVDISYKLLRVTSAVPVSLEIYDLSGRLVRRVYEGENPVGEYSHVWDGRDDSNGLVPPGLYLYRLVVDVQSGREISSGVVSVAY